MIVVETGPPPCKSLTSVFVRIVRRVLMLFSEAIARHKSDTGGRPLRGFCTILLYFRRYRAEDNRAWVSGCGHHGT